MGTFLTKNIKFKNGTIHLYGATSNVRPLYFGWSKYEDNCTEPFFYDLIAGTVNFKYNNLVSDKLRSVLQTIEAIHKDKYPMCNENYGIGDYSLYQMLKTHKTNKEEQLDGMLKHLSMYAEEYREEKRMTHRIYSEKWEEFSAHVEELYQIFLSSFLHTLNSKN